MKQNYASMKEWESAVKAAHGNVSFTRDPDMTMCVAKDAKGVEVGKYAGKAEGGAGEGSMNESIGAFSITQNSTPEVTMSDAPSADSSIAVGTPEVVNQVVDQSYVSVYANNITPVSYGDSEAVACFDVVFSVGVRDDNGATKTYQVVKRIGVDKSKIAAEAGKSAPVSIVEGMKVEDEKAKPLVITEAKRMRILAGLE